MAKKKAQPPASTTPSQAEPTAASKRTPEPASQPTALENDVPQHDGPSSSTPDQRTPTPASTRWSGSWRGKASAVAEVAKDSISVAASNASERLPSDSAASVSANRLSERLRTPKKSSATTQVTLGGPSSGVRKGSAGGSLPQGKDAVEKQKKQEKRSHQTTSRNQTGDAAQEVTEELKERPLPAAGWKGYWWSRPAAANVEKGDEGKQPAQEQFGNANDKDGNDKADTEPSQPSEAEQRPVGAMQVTGLDEAKTLQSQKGSGKDGSRKEPDEAGKAAQRASWFGLWNSGEDKTSRDSPSHKAAFVDPTPTASNVASDGFSALDEDKSLPSGTPAKTESTQDQARRSGTWAFWSREQTNSGSSRHKRTESEGENGELAIARTNTESHPKPAKMSEPEASKSGQSTPAEPEQQLSKEYMKNARSERKKRREPSLADSILKTTPRAPSEDSRKSAEDSDDKSLTGTVKKQLPQTLILPGVADTLPVEETPTYLQSMWGAFRRAPIEAPKHLTLSKQPPKVKKAVAVGVHGYFPIPLLQKVLGPPTGTSLKFANSAASSISSYLSATQPAIPFSIEKIALEGEGMIASRVETLWKLLLNFTNHLRTADFILIACHSQGVPVSIMLLSKLLNFGVLKSDVRLGVCAMAGINLGPFASYQSRFLGTGSANELFDFARPESTVSKQYAAALTTCLQYGTRITYVGSIDDQLVSLESSLHTTISHPGIYRAVFVDGRIHAPGFVTALVGLANKLRNLGVDDHGLIRELSAPLAGSLYGGEGHSRIYEDESVYELAVEFALTSTGPPPFSHAGGALSAMTSAAVMGPEPDIQRYEVSKEVNPYLLPWALRGILGEDVVRTTLKDEVEELRDLFERWKPVTKQLKDVKVRLEGLRSKL